MRGIKVTMTVVATIKPIRAPFVPSQVTVSFAKIPPDLNDFAAF
jgi:hypothetical protein